MRPFAPAAITFALLILFSSGCVTTLDLVDAHGEPDGRAIYARRCSQCHEPFDPADYTDEEWARNVEEYAPRAGVPPEWRPAVVAYLQDANDRSERSGAGTRSRSQK